MQSLLMYESLFLLCFVSSQVGLTGLPEKTGNNRMSQSHCTGIMDYLSQPVRGYGH
jgi:hypothetical protein